jgi:2-polyprenyl-3-methyl-5-hydroxy-6-metoxy-1,4-benzoquinol methylase
LSDVPSDWFDGYFEEEWLDEIALQIPEQRTRKEVDFVLERLELEPGAHVLDVACGHGRHSLELARRGFRVTGVDLSPRSIELAREAAAREGLDSATFVERDARALDFDGEFDGAINLFTSVLGYLDAEAENRRVVEAVARALRPRGSFLVDTINLLSLARSFQELHWEEFDSGTLMIERRAFDFDRGRSIADWTFVSRDGSRKTIRHSLRVYAPHELIAMFEAAGLDVVGRWGNFDGDEISFDAWRLILRGVKRSRVVG